MNSKIKSLWASHLRSDMYVQNFETDEPIPLRTNDNKWSPFGVLCNLHAQEFPLVAEQEVEVTSYLDYEYLIPREVAVWAGLISPGKNSKYETSIPINKVEIFGKMYHSIEEMFMNSLPFFMIADIIESRF